MPTLSVLERVNRTIILAVIAFLPFYYLRFKIGPLPTNIIEVLIVVVAILSIPVLRSGKLNLTSYLTNRELWFLLFLLLGITMGMVVADGFRTAAGIWKGWFILPLIFGACCLVNLRQSDLKALKAVLFFNLSWVSLYAVLQWGGHIPLVFHQGPEIYEYLDQLRAVGFFESPNYLAMYLLPPMLFLGVLGHSDCRAKGKLPAEYWLLIYPLAAILLSGSRAAILGGVLTVLALVAILTTHRQIRLITVTLMILVAAILPILWQRTSFDSFRFFIWDGSLRLLWGNPLLGIGPGGFREAFTALSGLDQGNLRLVQPYLLHPHNLFLNLWLSAGILGLIGFVGLIGSFLRRLFTSRTTATLAATAALLGVLAHGLLDATYFKNDLSVHFWLFVAVGLMFIRKDDKSRA